MKATLATGDGILSMTPADATVQRSEFCARLKRERESRGVSLAAIADRTKVKSSLLDALERGDLSRWPKGIYRRSFFRDYVLAAGLPVDEYTPDFLLLFCDRDDLRPGTEKPAAVSRVAAPEPGAIASASSPAAVPVASQPIAPLRAGSAAPVTSQPATVPADPFRLTFVESRPARRTAAAPSASGISPVRALLAVADVALVVLVALGSAWLFGKDAWQLVSVVALGALAVASLTGHGPAAWLFAQSASALEQVRARASSPALAMTGRPSVRTRKPASSVVARAKAAFSFVREYFDRLSYGASMTARNQRNRELMGVRRRRVETANASGVDEAGII